MLWRRGRFSIATPPTLHFMLQCSIPKFRSWAINGNMLSGYAQRFVMPKYWETPSVLSCLNIKVDVWANCKNSPNIKYRNYYVSDGCCWKSYYQWSNNSSNSIILYNSRMNYRDWIGDGSYKSLLLKSYMEFAIRVREPKVWGFHLLLHGNTICFPFVKVDWWSAPKLVGYVPLPR